ncbi:MAG: efflux RND transporter periplasmic adaptor subunit [Candidatus Eisenbacteria bacterium]
MKRNGTSIALMLMGVAAVGLTLAGCGGGGEATVETEGRIPVEFALVSREMVAAHVDYSGTVQAGRKALLGAEVQGRVERLHVDVGDRVSEGDLLAELAGEQLTQARAQAVTAEKDWERARNLLEKGAISEQAYDHALAGLEVARATHEMVLASCQLRAPFDGVITERYLDEGEVYTLMSMATASPAIFELADASEVKVVFEVGERDRALISKGLEADVSVDSHPGRTFSGVVARVDPALDMMSRTATVEIAVSNPRGDLMPGTFADVDIVLDPRETLVVPRDSLIRQEGTGTFFVYVVNGGTVSRQVVELGVGFGGQVEVVEGLEGGERVVTAGRYRLHAGAEVEPRAAGDGGPDATAEGGAPPEETGSGEEDVR